jgi:hypothetical protein
MPAHQGLQVIGVLNIVFGAISTAISLFALAATGLLAMFGGMMTAAAPEAAPVGGILGLVGGLLMLIIGIGLIFSILLIVAGAGVLKRAPWGRTMSLVWAVTALLLQLIGLPGSLNPVGILTIAYAIALLVLLNNPDWKAEFAAAPQYAPPPPSM